MFRRYLNLFAREDTWNRGMTDAIAKMHAFWISFAQEPDSILTTGRPAPMYGRSSWTERQPAAHRP